MKQSIKQLQIKPYPIGVLILIIQQDYGNKIKSLEHLSALIAEKFDIKDAYDAVIDYYYADSTEAKDLRIIKNLCNI